MPDEDERKVPGVAREYANGEIAVYWSPQFCIHTAMCLMGNPQVFDAGRRPWIDISQASADEIAEVVMSCPTGALHFRRLDGGPQEEPPAGPSVQPRRNGPLFVRGNIRVVDARGEVIREDTRAAFCRCGGSENKPFCDGTHKYNGFKAN